MCGYDSLSVVARMLRVLCGSGIASESESVWCCLFSVEGFFPCVFTVGFLDCDVVVASSIWGLASAWSSVLSSSVSSSFDGIKTLFGSCGSCTVAEIVDLCGQ